MTSPIKGFVDTLLNGFSAPLLILIVSVFRKDLRLRRLDFTTALGYIAFVAIGVNLAEWLSVRVAHPADAAFLRVDAALGFSPIAFADAIARHGAAVVVLTLAYYALPIAMAITWVTEQSLKLRRAALLGGCFCFFFYVLFPAVGPGHFDWARGVAAEVGAPINCMPSMHFTWALLLALNARSAWLRGTLWIYAGLIAAATIGLREHYLIDLIAAVPYALAVQFLAGRLRPGMVFKFIEAFRDEHNIVRYRPTQGQRA